MFSLTVLDHVRLDSEHLAQNYTVHARAADRLATAAFASRIVMAILLALASAAAVANLLFADRYYQVTTLVACVAAAIGFSLYSVLGLEGRVLAHRSFAHRLWIVCERYRALIAEASEGVIDRAMLLDRRDDLIAQVHAIYERGFGPDQRAFDAERLAAIAADRAA